MAAGSVTAQGIARGEAQQKVGLSGRATIEPHIDAKGPPLKPAFINHDAILVEDHAPEPGNNINES